MSRLFKKIQNAPIKITGNIPQEMYSNINSTHPSNLFNYKIIVGIIFFILGGVMSYLIVDNMDCFCNTASVKTTDTDKTVFERPAVKVEKLPVVSQEESKSPTEKKNTISLSKCLKKWMNKKLQNPILQKENITHVVNELSGVVAEANAPIKASVESELTPQQQEHLRCIRDFLKRFQIECVRIDGAKSRVQANGRSYMVNTIVSQYPQLRLAKIANGEIIFTDENNKEYRKEISQYE